MVENEIKAVCRNCSLFELCFLFFFFVIFQLHESRKHLVYSFRERSLEDLTLNEAGLSLPKINHCMFFRCFFSTKTPLNKRKLFICASFVSIYIQYCLQFALIAWQVSLHTMLWPMQRVPIDRQVRFTGWNELRKKTLAYLAAAGCKVFSLPSILVLHTR